MIRSHIGRKGSSKALGQEQACVLEWNLANFSVKIQVVNTFGLLDLVVSVAATQVCRGSMTLGSHRQYISNDLNVFQ